MTDKPRGPLIIELEQEPLPEAPSPASAPPPVEPASIPEARATAHAIAISAGSGWSLGRAALMALGSLLMLWIGISITDFATGLFARAGWLGWLATGLLGLFVVLLVVICLRELAALARLGRVEKLHAKANDAVETGSIQAADEVIAGLQRLYQSRSDLEWGRDRLKAALPNTPDSSGKLAVAERELMAPLDKAAEQIVIRTSRTVAAATALIPLALVDVVAALTGNLRMVRKIAEIYGGRAGWFGSIRLMRAVAAHLIATGAVAVADDLIGPLIGGGVLSKLSRRFGEGAVNGALTARVGVAAIEICRPLPFQELARPRASALVLRALQAWRSE